MRRSVKVDSDVRIVIIDGVDTIACGGIHCYHTGEIGLLFYAGQEMIRGHVRLQFIVGEEARNVFHRQDSLVKDLCVLHSAQEENLLQKEQVALEKSQMAERKIQSLEQSLATLYLQNHAPSDVSAVDVTDAHLDFKVFYQVVTGENKALLLIQRDQDFMRWLVYLSGCYGGYPLKEFKHQLLVLVDGKGGGKPPVWQGKGNAQQSTAFMQKFVTIFTDLAHHEQ
jgi:alanyl-tRNA synthetase